MNGVLLLSLLTTIYPGNMCQLFNSSMITTLFMVVFQTFIDPSASLQSYYYQTLSPNNLHDPSITSSTTLAAIKNTNDSISTRRSILQKSFLTTISTTSLSFIQTNKFNNPSNALVEQCRPKARNCIRTIWTAPISTVKNKEDAVRVIKDVINQYPQNGQNGIDCNGWSIVKDFSTDGDSSSNVVALEYRSCIGPAALAINLAQPFVDDVILEFDDNSSNNSINGDNPITVQVKSSSRMGSSDLNVNKKRIEFLGDKLRLQGWIVPNVKYGERY